MRRIYLVALALLMASFAFSQRAEKAQKTEQLSVINKVERSTPQTTENRSVNATFFEGFESGLPATWTVINNDADPKQWQSNAGFTSTPEAYNGDSCVVVSYNSAGNDDWLISPAITLADGDELSFYATSTGQWLESFNVKVSTTTTDMASFTIDIASEIEIAGDYTRFFYTLTDNAAISAGDVVYVAIQCVSVDKNLLRLDDFSVNVPIVDPIASLSLTEANFGFISASKTIDISLSNQGAGSLTVTSATDLSGTDFTTTFDATAVTLAANEAYSFSITYASSTLGADAETFELVTSAGTLTINLSGEVIEAPVGSLIWDNTAIGSLSGFTSTELGTLTPGDLTMADDFVVPAGQTWSISSVLTAGFSNTTPAIDNFTVKIYEDNAGSPGAEIFTEAITSNENNDFNQQTLTLATPFEITAPGKYWINIYAVYTNGDDLATSTWSMYMGPTAIEAVAVLKDSPDLLGAGVTSWTPIDGLFAPAPNSLYFQIYGTTGTITDPIAAVDQDAFNFGYVDMGGDLTTTDITLSNAGGGTITVTSVTDITATDFSTTFDATAASVTPYTFTITYSPSDLGADTQDFVIETNGGTLTLDLSGEGVEAPGGVILVDNSLITPTSYFTSTELGTLTPGDVTLADDFELPAGATWNISTIVTKGNSSSAVAIDYFVVKIYSDDNNAPGNEIFSENITSNQANSAFDQTLVFSNPLALDQAGKYWINVYAYYATGDAIATTGWGALTGTELLGSNLMIKDTPDLLGAGLTTWTDLQPLTTSSLASLYFKIYGDVTTTVDPINTSKLNIYPNPTTGLVKISKEGSVEVYNMLGQIVLTENNSRTLDLTSFENGTYIVKVISENETLTKKINLIK